MFFIPLQLYRKGKRILLKDLPDTFTPTEETATSKLEQSISVNRPEEKPASENMQNRGKASPSEEKVGHFGTSHTAVDDHASLETPPSSISLKESYDIAYAHSRKLADSNLLELVEKEMIQRTLSECGGNQVKASALLGITRATLRKRIDAYSIRY